jgi:hypothetical protein
MTVLGGKNCRFRISWADRAVFLREDDGNLRYTDPPASSVFYRALTISCNGIVLNLYLRILRNAQ